MFFKSFSLLLVNFSLGSSHIEEVMLVNADTLKTKNFSPGMGIQI